MMTEPVDRRAYSGARPGASEALEVLGVISNESISGPGRQLAALAVALRHHNVHLRVAILHRTGNPDPPFAQYLRSLTVSVDLVEDHGPLDFSILGRARALFDRSPPALIQTHGYKASAVAWALRMRGNRIPWLGVFHGETHEDVKARFYHWMDHRMLSSADRIVVMSQLQRAAFARAGDRVRVIHNAVLPEPHVVGPDDGSRLDALARTIDRPILGVIGRLSREKGVDVFLDACALLHRAGQPFSALIAGDGPDRGMLDQRAIELGVDRAVHFLGAVRNVAAFYRNIDALVIPSRSEGLPNVLLEALRADVPVVSTRVGAVPEVLSDPASGIIVDVNDGAALARAIPDGLALGHDPAAIAARAAVAEAFSVERRVSRHIDLYRELIGSPALDMAAGNARSNLPRQDGPDRSDDG